MRKLCLSFLFFILIINTSYAFDSNSLKEASKQTSIYSELSYDSKLKLPMEGESIDINFIMTPYLGNIETNESFYVYYFFASPDGREIYNYEIPGFPQGPYEYGKKYNTHITYRFDTPGIWKIYFFVITEDGIKNNSNEDIRYFTEFTTQRIHVLSYYEANSMIQSKNSYIISILGIIGTFLGFILGTTLNFLYDSRKLSPKIRVKFSQGFVANRMPNTEPIRTFIIEAINYGRIPVTLSGVGIEFENADEILTIIESEIIPIEFPKELLPGTSYQIIKDYENLKNTLEDKKPKKAFFRDQTGKKFYSKNIDKIFNNINS